MFGEQLAALEKPFMERWTAGKVPTTHNGTRMVQQRDQMTWSTISSLKKPIRFDEAAIEARASKEREFRDIALANYGRCVTLCGILTVPLMLLQNSIAFCCAFTCQF